MLPPRPGLTKPFFDNSTAKWLEKELSFPCYLSEGMLRAPGKRKTLKSRGEAFAMCFPPPGGMMDRTRRRYLGDGAGDLWLLENIIVFNLLMAFYQDLSETAVRSKARYLMKSKINTDKIILQVGARG